MNWQGMSKEMKVHMWTRTKTIWLWSNLWSEMRISTNTLVHRLSHMLCRQRANTTAHILPQIPRKWYSWVLGISNTVTNGHPTKGANCAWWVINPNSKRRQVNRCIVIWAYWGYHIVPGHPALAVTVVWGLSVGNNRYRGENRWPGVQCVCTALHVNQFALDIPSHLILRWVDNIEDSRDDGPCFLHQMNKTWPSHLVENLGWPWVVTFVLIGVMGYLRKMELRLHLHFAQAYTKRGRYLQSHF